MLCDAPVSLILLIEPVAIRLQVLCVRSQDATVRLATTREYAHRLGVEPSARANLGQVADALDESDEEDDDDDGDTHGHGYRFPPSVVVRGSQLYTHLRNGESFEVVVRLASGFGMPPDAYLDFLAKLDRKEARLPSRTSTSTSTSTSTKY